MRYSKALITIIAILSFNGAFSQSNSSIYSTFKDSLGIIGRIESNLSYPVPITFEFIRTNLKSKFVFSYIDTSRFHYEFIIRSIIKLEENVFELTIYRNSLPISSKTSKTTEKGIIGNCKFILTIDRKENTIIFKTLEILICEI